MPIQPMRSAKIHAGRYAVLGTSTACEVRSFQWMSLTGWELLSNGQHVKSFATKREALVYCQEHPEL